MTSQIEYLGSHMVEQLLFPSQDKQLWLAVMALRTKYPNVSYWSFDGYHAQALCDYSLPTPMVWCDNRVRSWYNGDYGDVILETPKHILDMQTDEICNIWLQAIGETEESKRDWIRMLRQQLKEK